MAMDNNGDGRKLMMMEMDGDGNGMDKQMVTTTEGNTWQGRTIDVQKTRQR